MRLHVSTYIEIVFRLIFFFFSSRRRHTRLTCDWSSDVCSSDLDTGEAVDLVVEAVEALDDGLLNLLDRVDGLAGVGVDLQDALVVQLHLEVLRPRSEERRVGKEWRSRGAPDH